MAALARIRPLRWITCAALLVTACTNEYAVLDVGPGTSSESAGGGATTTTAGTGASGAGAVAGTGGGGSGVASSATSGGSAGAGAGGCGDTSVDPDNCGACGHACVDTNASQRHCIAGVCNPVCDAGTLDCKTPAAPAPDDGCETAVGDADCGTCGFSCSSVGMVCQKGIENICVCTQATDCQNGGVCQPNGSCKCNAFHCAHGEFCTPSCECNGGPSCENVAPGFQLTCCPAASQLCVDLETDPAHCGGCGNACPPAWTCAAGTCAPS